MQHKKDGATKKIGWVYLKMAAISSPYTFDKTIATIEFLVKFWVKYMPKVQTASLSLVLKYLLTVSFVIPCNKMILDHMKLYSHCVV